LAININRFTSIMGYLLLMYINILFVIRFLINANKINQISGYCKTQQ
jgi:hypothetical protein